MDYFLSFILFYFIFITKFNFLVLFPYSKEVGFLTALLNSYRARLTKLFWLVFATLLKCVNFNSIVIPVTLRNNCWVMFGKREMKEREREERKAYNQGEENG